MFHNLFVFVRFIDYFFGFGFFFIEQNFFRVSFLQISVCIGLIHFNPLHLAKSGLLH